MTRFYVERVFECQAEIRRLRNVVRHLEEELNVCHLEATLESHTDYFEIPIGDGKKLIFERDPDRNYNEVWVYIGKETKDGMDYVQQDIAVIRSAYKHSKSLEVINDKNTVEVLVYANSKDEDYTDKFKIDVTGITTC